MIRRVLHAFGVTPDRVRFVATSATIGDPKGEAGTQLKNFLARVSGCDPEKVFVVSGDREIPVLPQAKSENTLSLDELKQVQEQGGEKQSRYLALSAHPIATKLRELFTSKPAKPVAKLSDVCRVVTGTAGAPTREYQRLALEWLDVLTATISEDDTPFLPLRTHLFHQTLAGLWCCCDSHCSSKLHTKLDSGDWPFGMQYLEPRTRCECGAPVFELVACDDCGAIYLHAESKGNVVVQPEAVAADDEFALEIENAEGELLHGDEVHGKLDAAPMMICNRDFENCGALQIRKHDGVIVEKSSNETVSVVVYEPGLEGLQCPACTNSGEHFRDVFRTARVGAPFYLTGILPTLLEFAPDGDQPTEKTYRGRRLLTFTDSRQGTARLAARLQQDSERTKTRGLIYHNLLVLGQKDPKLAAQIRALQEIQAQTPSPAIANMLDELLLRDEQSAIVPFRNLQLAIQQRSTEFEAIRTQYRHYNRELFGGATGSANVAEALLLREVGRRPKRQNNIETMGMAAVCYPGLFKIKSTPAIWSARHLSHADWIDFLKIATDFVVRNGGSLEIRDDLRPWLELPYVPTALVSSNTEQLGIAQRRWPSVRRSKPRSTLIRLLVRLLKVDIDNPEGQDIVDTLLEEAWLAVKGVLRLTANGYVLPLEQIGFRSLEEVWICPYTRRFLDTTVCGMSPYLPKKLPEDLPTCEKTTIPLYNLPFGGAAEGYDPVVVGTRWIQQQPQIAKLREEGLWSTFNDRVVEFAMYYTAAEHSAQQPSIKLQEYEKRFKEGRINILSCSTTMEMGIDIGGVQEVAMNNVPPHPANYLQRAGRAGRRSETRSTSLTLCKSNPHDQSVFLNTRWAFDTVLPAPVVSLNSGIIVQRHVNSVVLSTFLRNTLKGSSEELYKLTTGWFFLDQDQDSPAERLASWCQSYVEGTDAHLQNGLAQLVRHTAYEGFSSSRLLAQCGAEISRVTENWMKEWSAILEQEAAITGDSSDPALKAIAFQKNRLANEYLLRELTTEGFLPAYGFPSNVVSFDNLTVSGLKDLSAEMNGTGENNRYFRRELASRDTVTALREYAPGSEVVLDGLVYRSAGITLNWHIPASEADVREIQAIRFAWRCTKCGASGTSIVLPSTCEVCGGESLDRERFLEPAGFAVDFYQDPHNNVSRQAFVPVERPWVSARGEWAPLPNPALGRFRSTVEGRVYHHSHGISSTNYAICLACGRAEPAKADGELPEIFSNADGHKKLRSKKGDRICPGSFNPWAIVKVALGHESRTDMLEIQPRSENGQWLTSPKTALTLAVALRDSLAELLGVQADELGCDARQMRSADGNPCYSIFIFDQYAAGYSSNAEHLLAQMLHMAAEILKCPKDCETSCPSCILDFDQRFEAAALDRHAALKFLNGNWLKALRLPEDLQFFGSSSRAEIRPLFEAILKEASSTDAGETRLYANGSEIDFAASGVRALAYKLLSVSRPVSVVVTTESLKKFSEADRYSLASLADSPGARVFVLDQVPKPAGAMVMAEVLRSLNSSVAWASRDTSIMSPTGAWGKSDEAIIFGNFSATNLGTACSPSSIRPKPVDLGDLELTIQYQLNGSIKNFGARFFKYLTQSHAASCSLLQDHEALLLSIEYDDRYLFTPASVALLNSVIRGLKQTIGPERFGKPKIAVHTMATRPDGKILGFKVYSDWPDSKMRDAVLASLMKEVGVPDIHVSEKMQHSRQLVLSFSNGAGLSLRFDQGVGYWHVASWAKGGANAISFNFGNANLQVQANAVADMDVWVEGQTAPTQVFAKLRTSKATVTTS